jgi:hypothetical protein
MHECLVGLVGILYQSKYFINNPSFNRILLVYPEICSRSLLASVDEKIPFAELMNGQKDLSKISISKLMVSKNKNEIKKVFYGKMVYHVQFPRKMESTIMKKMEIVLGKANI